MKTEDGNKKREFFPPLSSFLLIWMVWMVVVEPRYENFKLLSCCWWDRWLLIALRLFMFQRNAEMKIAFSFPFLCICCVAPGVAFRVVHSAPDGVPGWTTTKRKLSISNETKNMRGFCSVRGMKQSKTRWIWFLNGGKSFQILNFPYLKLPSSRYRQPPSATRIFLFNTESLKFKSVGIMYIYFPSS